MITEYNLNNTLVINLTLQLTINNFKTYYSWTLNKHHWFYTSKCLHRY